MYCASLVLKTRSSLENLRFRIPECQTNWRDRCRTRRFRWFRDTKAQWWCGLEDTQVGSDDGNLYNPITIQQSWVQSNPNPSVLMIPESDSFWSLRQSLYITIQTWFQSSDPLQFLQSNDIRPLQTEFIGNRRSTGTSKAKALRPSSWGRIPCRSQEYL